MQALSIDQLVGQVLGNYRLERFLGKGLLNAIYLGRHLASQRLDAVTMYLVPSHFSSEATARFLARFHGESAAITKLEHPHILPIYEYGEYVGTPYLVTPYVTQGSLADLLKRYGRYDHTAIVPILEQLASGIAYAHSNGYIHGTLRPSNVVVRDQDVFQVAGFGLMHMLQLGGIEKGEQPYAHLLTVGQTLLASPEYIAPEVVQGQVADIRSDIYALGCILFELLCGQPPFTGSDPLEVVKQHVNQDIPSLRSLYSEVPIALVSVVNQALSRDPARRFRSVEELKEAFIQASRGAAPNSVRTGPSGEEGLNWSEMAQMSERLQERSPDRSGLSNTGKWQLLPPIITGKLPVLPQPSTSFGASPTLGASPTIGASPMATDHQWYQSQLADVTLPPIVPAQPSYPVDAEGDKLPPYADPTLSAPSQPVSVAENKEQGISSLPPLEMDQTPNPGLNSMPGVYEDRNKLAESYSWWSQHGEKDGNKEEGDRERSKEGNKSLPYVEKREEYVSNAQSAQIPPREPLVLPNNWMAEPVASRDGRRDFGPSTKNRRKKGRRGVVALLATGSVVAVSAASAGVYLNLNYLQHLLGLTKQSPTARSNMKPNSVTPRPTQPATPNTNTQNKTGTVIGNTQQKANSAVDFTNPATDTSGILVRLANSTFTAYDRACTHVGVLVNYDPATKMLVCPAHGAVFDPANGGAVVKGPAQLPLPTIAIQVQADGTVTTV